MEGKERDEETSIYEIRVLGSWFVVKITSRNGAKMLRNHIGVCRDR